MSDIFYEVPILDDEGNQFAEFDAKLTCYIELDCGEPVVLIDCFDVDARNGKVKSFSALEDDHVMRTLFFRAKDYLEKDDVFINYVLNHSDDIAFVGRGANDPDGHFVKAVF